MAEVNGTESGLSAGFIGLGNQGGPMALRIARAGIPLTVWARRPAVLPPFVEAGAVAADDPAQLGARSRVVGLCVFGDQDVLDIGKAILPAMRAGSVLLVHSTVHPDTVATVAEMARPQGIAVLDAPVSGGGAGAELGELTVVVGGDTAALETARPVIATYAGLIAHLGGQGAGATAKLVNNAMMAANLATCHEAVRAGEALGIDRAALLELIAASSGSSFAHGLYSRRDSLSEYAHTVATLSKDIDLLEAVSARAQVPVDGLARHARRFFSDVHAATRALA